MAPRRVAALLALAAGSEAAWTVRWPHTAATATLLPAQPRLRLLRRECSASSLLPTARQRPRACTARPASSRASACATAGAPTHLSHRACPALRRCKRRMGGSRTAAPALLSAQDTLRGPRPVRLQAQVRQPLDELVGPLVQERGGGQGVGVPLEDVRDGYGGDAARRSHPNPDPNLTLTLTPTLTATLTLSRSSGAGARSATATRTTSSCSAPVTRSPSPSPPARTLTRALALT